jgi:hypothetical protein
MLLAAAGPISGGQKDEKLAASPAAATARGAGIPLPGGGGEGGGLGFPATPAASAPHRPMEPPPSSADAEKGRRICTSIPTANEYVGASPCSDSIDAQPSISHNHTSEAEKPQVADASASAPAPLPADGAARPAKEDKVMIFECACPCTRMPVLPRSDVVWCILQPAATGSSLSFLPSMPMGWFGSKPSGQSRHAHQYRAYTCATGPST